MYQVPRWRVILVAVVAVMGLAFAFPNFVPERMRDQIPDFLPQQAINLGLDLRGGSQLLLEIDKATLATDKLRMDREMAQVRSKAMELVNTSKQAAGKIDSAMARIRQVLHSNSGE